MVTPHQKRKVEVKGRSADEVQFWANLKQNQPDLPTSSHLAEQVIREITQGLETEHIKSAFSDLFFDAERKIELAYRKHEKDVIAEALRRTLNADLNSTCNRDDMSSYLADRIGGLDEYFLSISQGRKTRAGSAVEKIIIVLLRKLDYPFTYQPKVDGTPDFIFPDQQVYQTNPVSSFVFTVKRTVRERWRQVITEAARGANFFLGTLDSKITPNQLESMRTNRIQVVTLRQLKDKHYATEQNVISFEDFFERYLDPAMHRWREEGAIP